MGKVRPASVALVGGAFAILVGALTLGLGRDGGPWRAFRHPRAGRGALALYGRGRLALLAAADALVALALMSAMFSWGLAQIPALLLLIVATAGAGHPSGGARLRRPTSRA